MTTRSFRSEQIITPTGEQHLHAVHEAGYEANYDGVLLHQNPHPPLSQEFNAWESGHLQAQNTRNDWELCNRERAQQAEWREGADLE